MCFNHMNLKMCSKWSEDLTVKFVQLYKNEECLWNTKIEKYRNKQAREVALKRIQDAMGLEDFGPADIKTKIKNLRSTYAQEILKIKKSESAGAEGNEIYKPRVKWFPIMDSFLHNFEKRRESFGNFGNLVSQLCEVGEESEEIHNAETSQDEIEEPLYEEEPSTGEASNENDSTAYEPIPKYRKIERTNVKEVASNIRDYNSYTTSHHHHGIESLENEFDIFGKSVAVQLKKLPLPQAIRAQDQIQQILTRFRLESIENANVVLIKKES